MIIQNKMRNIRKQVKLVTSLVETLLQYRLDPFEGLADHLMTIRKKIRQMVHSQSYQEGISELLINKQNFQIRNKVNKFENEQGRSKIKQLCIQVRISAIQKCSCQIYNQQFWQFQISEHVGNKNISRENLTAGVCELMETVLKFLNCYNLLPLNKQNKNKYMIDHKVTIADHESLVDINKFQNMSNSEIVFMNPELGTGHMIRTKYFFNQRKIQQNLKQIISSKVLSSNLESSKNSKKYSVASTECTRRVSLYQYYDDQLDITVLSNGSDFGEDEEQNEVDSKNRKNLPNGEEIDLEILNIQDEEFQILIQESVSQDQLFLRDTLSSWKQLSYLQANYF